MRGLGDVLGPLDPSSDQQPEGVVEAIPASPVAGASSSEGSAVAAGPLSTSRPGTAGSSSANSFSPLADHYHFAQLDVASILGQSTSRLLSDRSYEKRSMAAHEIESRVRQALQQRDYYGQDQTATANIVSVITVLTSSNFTKSPYPNSRKGGLLGLASVAIALENKNLDPFLDSLISPVLYLFDDEDSRCRYYACEAMFNISKVARGLLLKGRRMCLALDGVCRLVADVDQEVKSGAQYLDRLLKDIVSDVANKPFILQETPPMPYEPTNGTEVSASPASESSWPASLNGYIPSSSPHTGMLSPTTSTSGHDAFPYRSTDDSIDAASINIITTPETPSLPNEPQGQRLMHLQQQTSSSGTARGGGGVGLFDLGAFIGRISAHLRVANPFIKQLAMSWISVLHSLPTTRDILLLHLPLFLGTLFSLQRDPSRGDLRHTADQVLGEFLDDLTSSAASALVASHEVDDDDGNNTTTIGSTKLRLIIAKSISIVVSNCSSTESLTRLTAMNWLYTILSTPGLLLPDLPTDEAVLDMPAEYDSPRVNMDANAASNLRALLPILLDGILGCVDAKEAEVSRKAVDAHTILLSAVEAIGGQGGGDGDGGRPLSEVGDQRPNYLSGISGDVNDDKVISVVCHYLSGPIDQTVTRACCLQWVSLLLEQSPQQMLRDAQCPISSNNDHHQNTEDDKEQHRPSLLDSVFATLQHPSSEVCIAALQVLSRIASLPEDDEYFPVVCTRLLELLRSNKKAITPSDDDMDEDAGIPSASNSNDKDAYHHHQQQKLQSLALRYRLIIRHLCCYIDVERFYRHIAQRLQDDEDAEFKSMAVYLFNWILLTAPETNTLREALYSDASTPQALAFTWQQLIDLAATLSNSKDSNDDDEDIPLFIRILLPWMSNPASALSLCLWVGRYELACKFVGIIAEDQVSIGTVPWSVRKGRITQTSSSNTDSTNDGTESLLQLDQLVHLLESPVFTKLRLELLPNSYLLDVKPEKEKRQCLLDCLVGLVMLVPQNTRAFQLLKERLDIVHKAFALCHHI